MFVFVENPTLEKMRFVLIKNNRYVIDILRTVW